MGRIFDCFIFYNELDLLELRLEEYFEHVDYFVISEANFTHQNKEKQFNFENNLERFKKFESKIIYLKVINKPEFKEGMTMDDYHWSLENYQRNKIIDLLSDINENDWVMLSDLDEFYNPEILQSLEKTIDIYSMVMQPCLYYFNLMEVKRVKWKRFLFSHFSERYKFKYLSDVFWIKSKAISGRVLRNHKLTDWRLMKDYKYYNHRYLHNAGFHFTYLGGFSKIMDKINSIVEGDINKEHLEIKKNPKILETCLKKNTNFMDEKSKLERINLEILPVSIRNNRERLSLYLC
ncbi:MAG: hypothetical protein SNJ77_11035 [Cytophagales bacterium]